MRESGRTAWLAGIALLAISAVALGQAIRAGGPVAKPNGNGAAAAAENGKVKLTAIPLESPELVASKADSAAGGVRLLNGAIVPKQVAQFDPRTPQVDITISGTKVSLLTDGRTFGMRTEFGAQQIQIVGAGPVYRAAMARLSKTRGYILAFPYGNPGTQRALLYYRSGFVLKGTIAGKPIFIYDDNTDGGFAIDRDTYKYGDGGGSVGVFAPMSKYIPTPTAVYQIDSLAEDGSELSYSKYSGETAKVGVSFLSEEMEMQAVFGASGGASFVAVANPRISPEFCTPPGEYNLQYGVVYMRGVRKVVGVMTPGKAKGVEASASTAKLAYGGPFAIEFTAAVRGDKLTIDPATFHVRGKGGEEYLGVKYATNPQIALSAGGRVVPVGKMDFG